MIAKLTTILACVFSCSWSALAAEAPDFTVKKIGEGVYAAISPDRSKAGSNAGFVVGSAGVVVVDTFVDVAPAKELLAEIRKITSLPIRFVVDTHYHLDHTGGNAVFADAGATILAHRNVRPWLRSENMKFFPEAKPEQKARVESLVLPDEVYTDAVDVYLGSRRLEVRYLRGHTGGDSVVIVPDANVVFSGDLVWQRHFPNLIDANTADWIKTLEKLRADHGSATFVSGHGDLATAGDVRNFHDHLVALRDDVAKALAQGKSGQEFLDSVSAQIKEKYADWGFQQFIPRNVQETAAEIKGGKKVPVAPTPAAVD